MSSKRSSRKRSLPTEPLRLEGQSGTYFEPAFLSEHRNLRHERKTRQLCEQVAEALNLALGASYDPDLAELYVEAVEPAPNASRMRAMVSGPVGLEAVAVTAALERAQGYLRRQVAAAIHRKRTPQLSFELIAPEVSS
jgi:ribosome-binding factor A